MYQQSSFDLDLFDLPAGKQTESAARIQASAHHLVALGTPQQLNCLVIFH